MRDGGSVLDQAIAWHLRLAEADEAEWAAFTAWLEQSPLHAQAYDEVALADADLAESKLLLNERRDAVGLSGGANDNLPARRWAWGLGGASLAAAAATLVLLPGTIGKPADAVFETPAGLARNVALADGSRVELAGGSRLRIDGSAPRLATVERGEALFHVRHDQAQPFTVRVNDVAVEDLGTVFAVARDSDAVRVAVAEGSVAVRRASHSLTLDAGDTALASADRAELSAGHVAPAAVGGWRSRTLTFQGEPLSTVVERLNRLYALHISLEPNLSGRPFTGMVQLTGDAVRDVPHLAALMGTAWRREGEGWRLSSAEQR